MRANVADRLDDKTSRRTFCQGVDEEVDGRKESTREDPFANEIHFTDVVLES